MTELLESLPGRAIVSVFTVEDAVHIVLDDGRVLSALELNDITPF